MSSDTGRTDTTLRYHLLGVLCWLYPVGYPRITGQGHTGVPCEKYCYLWIVAEFFLLAVLVFYVVLKFSKNERLLIKFPASIQWQRIHERKLILTCTISRNIVTIPL